MEDFEVSEEDEEKWLEEWREVDRQAASYLEDRIPGLTDPVSDDEARWLDEVVETFNPTDEPEVDPELFSSVMAMEHADWLGLVLGVVRRGPGSALDADVLLDDIDALEDVDGEIEDREGARQVLSMALLVLTPSWQDLGLLDRDERITDRGVWALPRAVHRSWTR